MGHQSTLTINFQMPGSLTSLIQFSSVQFSRSVVSNSLRPHELQHARPPCPSPTPRVHSDSCPSLCDPMDSPWNSPGQNTGVSSLFLLQVIFPTQELNPGLMHCRWILYQLSYQGSLTQHIILLLYMFPTSGWYMCHRCTTNIACMGVFCNYKRLHILCHRLFILRITSPFKNHST